MRSRPDDLSRIPVDREAIEPPASKKWVDIVARLFDRVKITHSSCKRVCFKVRELQDELDESWSEVCGDRVRSSTWRQTLSATLTTNPERFTSARGYSGLSGCWMLNTDAENLKRPQLLIAPCNCRGNSTPNGSTSNGTPSSNGSDALPDGVKKRTFNDSTLSDTPTEKRRTSARRMTTHDLIGLKTEQTTEIPEITFKKSVSDEVHLETQSPANEIVGMAQSASKRSCTPDSPDARIFDPSETRMVDTERQLSSTEATLAFPAELTDQPHTPDAPSPLDIIALTSSPPSPTTYPDSQLYKKWIGMEILTGNTRRGIHTPWSIISRELVFHVLSFLDVPSLCRLACVSRGFCGASCDGEIWRARWSEQWPEGADETDDLLLDNSLFPATANIHNYKYAYSKRLFLDRVILL